MIRSYMRMIKYWSSVKLRGPWKLNLRVHGIAFVLEFFLMYHPHAFDTNILIIWLCWLAVLSHACLCLVQVKTFPLPP